MTRALSARRPLQHQPRLRTLVTEHLRAVVRAATAGGGPYVDFEERARQLLAMIEDGGRAAHVPDLPDTHDVVLRRVSVLTEAVTCTGCGTLLELELLRVANDDRDVLGAWTKAKTSRLQRRGCCDGPDVRVARFTKLLPDAAVAVAR